MVSSVSKGRATFLAIDPNKVQETFELLDTMVWSKARSEWTDLCAQISAKRLEFSIVLCEDRVPRLKVKLAAFGNTKAVRDNYLGARTGFWKQFREQLDRVLPVPLAQQPCIL
ncbi:MAG TPA: hypothetical protein VMF11_08255 [Candidatus Baltobacteraceae bacterium]|nr:hypothetical protein [Candidatus Baltobacteraceae bacterium]